MRYQEAIDFLYSTAPMFQSVGKQGYKTGLDNTFLLDKRFGHPHKKYRTIHVAGTNGKGSTSHLIAAILQSAGYRVGLYTSPHLRDFRERIKVNGEMISKRKVAQFITDNEALIREIQPSFFEITTSLAFNHFAEIEVEIAVVEVGLGGRLDCTNVITPIASIITNISLDHTEFLGDNLEKIAEEKAGIIKPKIPVVIGETHPETESVFIRKAKENRSPIYFADKLMAGKPLPESQLKGFYQDKNFRTVLQAVEVLRGAGLNISDDYVKNGFAHVIDLTGLMGRWQVMDTKPTIVCDTGHNEAGITFIVEQLSKQTYRKLHIVFGMVADKKRDKIYQLLPKDATYYFTKASIPRALDEKELRAEASAYGLKGKSYSTVKRALATAKATAKPDDFIFVGGSTFIVAEVV